MKELARLQAPDVVPGEGMTQKRRELAHWLSDWHLISFLGTTQLVSQVSPRSVCCSEDVFLIALVHRTTCRHSCVPHPHRTCSTTRRS